MKRYIEGGKRGGRVKLNLYRLRGEAVNFSGTERIFIVIILLNRFDRKWKLSYKTCILQRPQTKFFSSSYGSSTFSNFLVADLYR